MIRLTDAGRAALGLAVVVLAGVAPAAAYAVPRPNGGTAGDEGKPAFDAREGQSAEVPSSVQRSTRSLDRSLGVEGFVRLDRRTASPASIIKTDGTLTGPSDKDPATVALDYVRAHATVFGLSGSEVDALKLVDRTTSRGGTVHLAWQQQYKGVPVLDNGLRADVTKDGRLIDIGGSPLRSLSLPSTTPALTASEALAKGREDADASMIAPKPDVGSGPERPTTFSNGDSARLVIFGDPRGARLAWRLVVNASSTEIYDTVVDATNGRILRRNNIVKFFSVNAVDHYPGAPDDDGNPATPGPGDVQARQLRPEWLATNATTLDGPNAHVVADPGDDITGPNDDGSTPAIDPSNEIQAANDDFLFPTQSFAPNAPGDFACPSAGCTWDPMQGNSWSTNRDQTAAQLFYFLNVFHDHLAANPIDLGDAQATAARPDHNEGGFHGTDRIVAQVDDGADGMPTHLPDRNHLNNANMATYPDGISGYMQMYLWGRQGSADYSAVSGADDASIVYHEYTHGLSNRLVTDSQGWGALNSVQAAAMGEAWSDWYALDFLAAQGYVDDTAPAGEIRIGAYEEGSEDLIRTEGINCPVGTTAPHCQKANGGSGGYTYGDFGRIVGEPEAHADGEIWAQTLWQIRDQLGSSSAEKLVTEGMRLLPPEPTMLDARNGILEADTEFNDGAAHDALWGIFADRGMGYFASTLGSWDAHPVADDHTPATSTSGTGRIAGTVTDADAVGGPAPVGNAVVGIGGHTTGDDDFSATTASDGRYSLANVPGSALPYMQVIAEAPGYSRAVQQATVTGGQTTTVNFALRRNWASEAANAIVTGWNGPNYQGCGPDEAVDGDQLTTWSVDVDKGPASVTVELPRDVDLTGYGIDPGAGCGDGEEASAKDYEVQWSTDGTTWQPLGSGSFGPSDNHRMNVVSTSTKAGARFVRLTVTRAQRSSADYIDVSDFEVYGKPETPSTGSTGGGTDTPPTTPTTATPTTMPATPLSPLHKSITPPTIRTELKGIKLSSSSTTASSSGLVQLTVTFPSTVPAQTGTAMLTLSSSRARAANVIKLGTARFTVKPGRKVRIRVGLSASGRKLLARRGTLRVRVELKVRDRYTRTLVKTATVTIKTPKHAARR